MYCINYTLLKYGLYLFSVTKHRHGNLHILSLENYKLPIFCELQSYVNKTITKFDLIIVIGLENNGFNLKVE